MRGSLFASSTSSPLSLSFSSFLDQERASDAAAESASLLRQEKQKPQTDSDAAAAAAQSRSISPSLPSLRISLSPSSFFSCAPVAYAPD